MEKTVTRDQMNTILQGRPKGVSGKEIIDTYVANGYKIEGINYEKPKPTLMDKAKDYATEAIQNPVETAKGVIKGIPGQSAALVKLAEMPGKFVATKLAEAVGADTSGIGLDFTPIEELTAPSNKAQEVGIFASNFLPAGKAVGLAKAGVEAVAPVIGRGIAKTVKPVTKLAGKGLDVVKSTADEALFAPTAEEATKTSLNPFIDNVAEVSIPVKSEGGVTKYVVKNAKDATPEDISAYKEEAGSLYNNFTTQAKKFMKERTVDGGSPVEQVGQKTDKYVEQVNKLRKSVGKQMGKIEEAAENVQVPFNNSQTVQDFVLETADALKGGAKYGPDAGITKEVQKLSDDILRLEKSGGSVKDTLNMTRKWARYLEDQKDKFGDFTANKGANAQIERVIKSIKDDARSVLSENNDTYRTLVEGYRRTSRFGEEAKRLLGQEGLYGDSIKGAATVKRAIQSNSDAGARQFLKTLRDITGYDAIKEGDIALKAMKDVGDYQGLSMLDVLSDVQGGLLGAAKNVAKKLTPKESTRVKKYINKDTSFNAAVMPKMTSYNAHSLSKSLKNSLLNDSKGKFDKPDRFTGEGYSYKEAKTGLAEDGVNHDNRIVIGKDDRGESIIIDGTHLLEAYRDLKLPIPKNKVQILK